MHERLAMNEPWTSVSGWLLHSAVGGSLVLLLTFLLMHWTRQPARRQRLGEFGLMAAMLVGLLSLVGPSWLVVAWHPRSGAQHEVTADGQPFAAKLVPPLDTAPPEAGFQIVDKVVTAGHSRGCRSC